MTLIIFLIALIFFGTSVFETIFSINADVLLQVMWSFFRVALPDTYCESVGTPPIQMMTTILAVRHLIFNGVHYYLNRDRRVFSDRVVRWMAGGYAGAAFVGSIFFFYLGESALRFILGISSLFWFGAIMVYLGKSMMDSRRERGELRAGGVTVSRECNLFGSGTSERSSGTKVFTLGAQVRRSSFRFPINWRRQGLQEGEKRREEEDREERGGTGVVREGWQAVGQRRPKGSTQEGVPSTELLEVEVVHPNYIEEEEKELMEDSTKHERHGGLFSSSILSHVQRNPARTPPPPLLEVFLSAVTNDVFYSHEATTPQLRESFVPALTPSKLSPCSTMTFTHVRINRVVKDGMISKACFFGGVIVATVAGVLASFIGVSSPETFFFQMMFNPPSYLFLNILLAHAIPGSVLRVLILLIGGGYRLDTIGIVVVFSITYLAGIFVGSHLSPRSLGKQSTVLYMCGLLLCQTGLLIAGSLMEILVPFILFFIVFCVSVYLESSRVKKELRLYNEIQQQREERRRLALEVLQREPSSTIHGPSVRERRVPYWANYDNDDEDNTTRRSSPLPPSLVRRPSPGKGKRGITSGGTMDALDTEETVTLASGGGTTSGDSLKSCAEGGCTFSEVGND